LLGAGSLASGSLASGSLGAGSLGSGLLGSGDGRGGLAASGRSFHQSGRKSSGGSGRTYGADGPG
jgi:hypothetical protein